MVNHVTVLLIEDNEEYILDSMNNFLLKKEKDNNLTSLDLNTTSADMKYFLKFKDNNIQSISWLLKKYYHLQSIRIKHINN